jgi:hypothetical protein
MQFLCDILPDIPPRIFNPRDDNWTAQYGAFDFLSKYAGLGKLSDHRAGIWQHGWFHEIENLSPEWLVGGDGKSVGKFTKGYKLWVFRKDQEAFLKKSGVEHVKAIGAPIIYVELTNVKRLDDSLLVMPPHLTVESKNNHNDNNYIEYIKSIKNNFEFVLACIGNTDFERGHWVKGFKNIGIDSIAGADIRDRNSLLRMAWLLRKFEYVTMLEKGSQLPYAAYFGAKASISGPVGRKDYKKFFEGHTFFRNFPQGIEILEYLNQTEIQKKMVGEFMVEPQLAVKREEWGKYQLGVSSRLKPTNVAGEMQWGKWFDAKMKLIRLKNKLSTLKY